MKRWLIRCTQVAGLAMGALLVTGTAAQAHSQSGPSAGLLNGNQASVSVHVPVDISNNAIAIFGFASSNGNGGSGATGSGASMNGHTKHHHGHGHGAGVMANDDNDGAGGSGWNAGLLNGNQLDVDVAAPVTVCGNAIAIFGFASVNC